MSIKRSRNFHYNEYLLFDQEHNEYVALETNTEYNAMAKEGI